MKQQLLHGLHGEGLEHICLENSPVWASFLWIYFYVGVLTLELHQFCQNLCFEGSFTANHLLFGVCCFLFSSTEYLETII